MNIPVTEWFPAEVKPTIPGLYQTDAVSTMLSYQFWNGKHWGLQGDKDDFWPFMNSHHQDKSMYQNVKWRGLTSPHSEWKP